MVEKQAILIAGPTASGKSCLALELAERHDGVIVNADSMQVYSHLQILTARPAPAEIERVPHRLYGHVPPHKTYSAGRYRGEVAAILADIRAAGKAPIFCGGTGLYFKALLGSLDVMPEVSPELRETWRRRLAEEGAPALHRLLSRRDPVAAGRIQPADGQRIVRALEVGEAGGMPLSALQSGRGEGLLDGGKCVKIVLAPERSRLREMIARRFDAMVAAGALDEVAAFRAFPGALAASAGKAIGVAELGAVLDGGMSLDEATARAVTRSRQYAKRQETWFRHQFGADWARLETPDAKLIPSI
ncbi:tRNA (adenosine(37)-N6)-dimethylallyltransferase MiaA [Aurantimonas marina]|uniref:tRNA (adenosine(37)-N6)-dimethylallyltransferase MiaA n=1 Tax=Aurantimonas marina TaxID=2780508 RepID=UPI0019D2FD99|nr:tRNA (adenosine(37)-N6)-dimethylallyltransferase MiaA [Aurantimonas marina]